MRGPNAEQPYRCMLCGIDTYSHDEMIEHYRKEHPEYWSHVKKPTELDEVFGK